MNDDPLTTMVSPFWRIETTSETLSTNASVAERARHGEPAGLALLADHQIAGRGRRGNRWEAPPGTALLLSVLLRPSAPVAVWPRLAIAAAVAVCLSLEEAAGLAPQIKWPNDILADGCKIAGILLESCPPDTRQPGHLVIGIGLNVHTRAFPLNLRYPATSIVLAAGRAPARTELATIMLGHLHAAAGRAFDDWAAVLADYRQRDATFGRRVQLESPGGILTGTGAGLAGDGSLLLHGEGEAAPRAIHDGYSLVLL